MSYVSEPAELPRVVPYLETPGQRAAARSRTRARPAAFALEISDIS